MKERKRPVVKVFRGAVIQLILKPLFDLFNLRNDRSVRSALFFKASNWSATWNLVKLPQKIGRFSCSISIELMFSWNHTVRHSSENSQGSRTWRLIWSSDLPRAWDSVEVTKIYSVLEQESKEKAVLVFFFYVPGIYKNHRFLQVWAPVFVGSW